MENIEPKRWDPSWGPLEEATLRSRYPAPRFRVAFKRLPRGHGSSGAMHEGICFVLAGEAHYKFAGVTISIPSGAFAELPQGSYELHAVGIEALHAATVFDLRLLLPDAKA